MTVAEEVRLGATPGPVPLGPGPRPLRGVIRGREEDPVWVRPCLLVLLAGTAALYLVDLTSSGWGNGFYAAAVQASTHSWKATLFGSFDPSNFITVDKPPAALWVMDASARLFGLNPWSVLAPEAAEGVATVGLVYLSMRRAFSAPSALLAGLALAVTPVATLMFRFDNPDALLTLMTVAATYATLRAVEDGRTRWLVLAGALLGVGFLTKYLQVLLVVPPLAGTYLVAGPPRTARRMVQLAAGGAALVGVAASWCTVVVLTPAADRPWIGSTSDNNLLNLIFGYNGFGRLTGNEHGSVGFQSAASAGGGGTGPLRMLDVQFRTQIGWLLPTAVLAAAVLLVVTRRAPRTDRRRAATLAWLGSLLVSAAVFSMGKGIIHPYYAVFLAPSIAALVAGGSTAAWRRRHAAGWAAVLAGLIAVTAGWAWWILAGAPPWASAGQLLAGVLILALAWMLLRMARTGRSVLAAGTGLLLALAAPAGVSLETVFTDHATAIPSAGIAVPYLLPRSDRTGGLLVISRPTARVSSLLSDGAGRYRWAAATVGSERAAGLQLGSGAPVMAVGGFNGTDPAPTLTAFQGDVSAGLLHWFVTGGQPLWAGAPGTAMPDARAITAWVEHTFQPLRCGPFTLWNLTSAAGRR